MAESLKMCMRWHHAPLVEVTPRMNHLTRIHISGKPNAEHIWPSGISSD